jgi:hypothetical protein
MWIDKLIVGLFLGFIAGVAFMFILANILNSINKDK